ncbi:hypothetical protein TSUD_379780 [Trifolium subterraneum]|uniref:Mitochondrial pyruvate carrier n=2 Tax=Trifolium TaxID=3898 RepID=A0A2Z6MDJ0_TRISU|nr:hypothetical protein TSUD_379780 [Trifolium subterraneum]
MASSKLQAFLNHPAGPKTGELLGIFACYVHCWMFDELSIANIADFTKPPENISYPQQIAVLATGLIWSRYSTQITPKNWNLVCVNLAMAGTSVYQLSRKLRQDYFSEETVAKE